MITIQYEDEKLLLSPSGNDFHDEIESLKLIGCQYRPKDKKWIISAGMYQRIITELSHHYLDISEYDKHEIAKYFKSLNELKVVEKRSELRKFDPTLLKVPPIQPTGDTSQVKSFQELDIIRGLNQNRFLFAHATGLGKSYVLAALLSHLRHYGECHKAIIMTSTIGILNLANELKKFIPDYDESKTLTIRSVTTLKNRLIFNKDQDYEIIICSYDAFRSIGDAYDKEVNKRTKKVQYRKSSLPLDEWFGDKKGLVFLDECHLLGSPKSLRSKFFLMNLHFFEYRYLMSATPADKEEKMYLLLRTLDRSLVNGLDYQDWLGEYCELGTKWSKYGINRETWDHEKWAILQDALYKKYAVKREKDLLGLLPAYDVPLIQVDMSPQQREIYEAFTYEVVSEAKRRNTINAAGLLANVTNTFMYLQLAVDNPLLLLQTKNFDMFDAKLQANLKKFNFNKHFEKLKALDLIIEEECKEKDNKIIVFYYHPLTLECLKNYYKKGFHVLSADIPKDERFEVIESFKKSKDKILFASILIANSSITLNEAKASVYFERTHEYITYEQSRGRNYRIGQTEEVRYYNLVYNNSIDYLMILNLEKKGKVVENLIKKNVLSQEEWKSVFNADADILGKLS